MHDYPKTSPKLDRFVTTVCADYKEKNVLDPALYEKYHVRRGLRNADGTGVLAGITRIGSVQGAFMQDGERIPMEGELYYRGIEINDLIQGFVTEKRFGFEETIYLLLLGQLPTPGQLSEFTSMLSGLYDLPDDFTENMIIKAPSKDVMNKLSRSLLALYSYDATPDDCSASNLMRQSIELISRIPIIVSHAYAVKRHYYDNQSLVLHRPQKELSIAENILYTLRPTSNFTEEEAHVLDLCLVLHAEHGGGNNSAFAARVLSSSGTDTYSAMAAAVGSLKGPRHGGANNKVVNMMKDIQKNVVNWDDKAQLKAYLSKLILKQAGDRSGLIYGMGHAVYTKSDPRAVLLKGFAKKLAANRGRLAEYQLLEDVETLTPEVFADIKGDIKTISANVDLYSGFVYDLCDIPEELFTPVFAIARMVGWCAHRMEECLYGGRIIRPAYRSVAKPQKYTLLSDRK